MKKIFWIAGEKSGDLHSSIVLKELQLQNKEYQHVGIGGPLMRKFGLKPMFPFDRFAVMGFIEVVKHLFFFVNVEKKIRQLFRENPPDLVVLVDYPGLNMRIAQQASKLGIPVLYFISPQFWAWKFKRIFKLKKLTDHLAYILPFEGKYFDKFGVKSTYVGHPIAQEIEIKINKKDHKLLFEIKDTGVGIPREDQKRIFQKFFRSMNVMRHQTQGSGLGLYIAKSIVEKSGGKIWFKSKEGEGTTFWFTLPIK